MCQFSTRGIGDGPLSLLTFFAADPCGANPPVSTLVPSGGDIWKEGGEHWAGKGRRKAKMNQMESTGKTEDVLAGRVETSRLDGGTVRKAGESTVRFLREV